MRTLLLFVLVCSQAIAPMLHAHVGGEHHGDGIHIHNGFDGKFTSSALPEIESVEGLVVGVAEVLVSRPTKVARCAQDNENGSASKAFVAVCAGFGVILSVTLVGLRIGSFSQPVSLRSYFLPRRRGPPAI